MTANQRLVVDALDGIVQRLRVLHALYAAAAGGCVAAIAAAVALVSGSSPPAAAAIALVLAAACGGVVFARLAGIRTRGEAARLAERRVPAFRNLLITAAELVAHPQRVAEWMRERVMQDSARMLREHPERLQVALKRALALCVSAQLAWLAVLAGIPQAAFSTIQTRGATVASLVRDERGGPSLRVVIEPPAYTGLRSLTLVDPERVEAVEGSRLRFVLRDANARVRIGSTALVATRQQDATAFELIARDSSYVAIEPDASSASGAARLIALTVIPDRAPVIRVEQPGRDLLLPEAAARVDLRARATDDHGLHALELRYTKVSGTGEQFEFVEGSLPMAVTQTSGQAWEGTGHFDLRALGLAKGDSLVYRVVARDGRPGASGAGASDTYFIEIAGPGQVALAGVDMPPEHDRYALSQQMIVLKIDRLRAREAVLDRTALRDEAETIAAEQRAVRANFIFLMGGHVEDEEAEAEQSHEIQEGRLENRARRDIAAAVRHMTDAERGLAAVNTAAALPPARAAVEALQRAFGHSRYILRTLPVRSRIDPSRRLSRAGDISGELVRDARDASAPTAAATARHMLAALMSFDTDVARNARLGSIAEQALSIDPTSATWQKIARDVIQLRDAAQNGAPAAERRKLLQSLAGALTAASREDALAQSTAIAAPTRLSSAWADRRRR